MLEGQEVKKEYDGGAGVVSVDVDDKGAVIVLNSYKKNIDGLVNVSSESKIETNIFMIAERIASKTQTQFDDKVIAGIKSLLGIQ